MAYAARPFRARAAPLAAGAHAGDVAVLVP